MSAAETKTGCDCLNEVSEKLKETGHILASTMFGRPDRPTLQIIRRDTWKPETRRGKVGTFIPTFCPFCGLQYGGSVSPFDKPDATPAAPSVSSEVDQADPARLSHKAVEAGR